MEKIKNSRKVLWCKGLRRAGPAPAAISLYAVRVYINLI